MRRYYWVEDEKGIVRAHGTEAKIHRREKGTKAHLYYSTYPNQRPPIGVHADSWDPDAPTPLTADDIIAGGLNPRGSRAAGPLPRRLRRVAPLQLGIKKR